MFLFKFNNSDSLKNFEENFKNIISDLRQSFTFKENNFVGVCAYSFEKEAIVTVRDYLCLQSLPKILNNKKKNNF